MWTWLRTLLPELGGTGNPPLGDRGGLDWLQVMDNQRIAVLRRGGLMNLAAAPSFVLLWGIACLGLFYYALKPWLLLLATCSLLFSLGLFRRYRLIADTPTSTLSSGAQGYVELQGKAALPDGVGFRGLPHLPVTVWLPGYVEDEPFVLDDGKGRCLLYPRGAEIIACPGDSHYSWLNAIYPGQTLYALGELHTLRSVGDSDEQRERLAALLAEWKSNPLQLRRCFDVDGNGQIDPDEWQQVLVAAQRWVTDDLREQQRAPGTHVMDGAKAGQLFLITNIPPEKLAGRYRQMAFVHLLYWLSCLLAMLII
ncbi:MAG TPA: EF-hand domain-containing protein [Candidatus Thiothrix moscowensis]|uniref:EF-hand domain-containing protein n=1 Tax=unclassified Thiothrix TaxID=2636184 RepID=UPI0025DF4F84|nr:MULTISPECIES: EF-hand domain-containing protein [unclassified Thiothrix]HRJ51792.1 EF-hand domain-containing protein [Candidatus Thiothrix moscowensis]HRJ92107.1 EF-hand domain-containing protein [Candidatus Thiothrix moscowensis]